MKKFDPILDCSGNELFSSDDIAKAAANFENRILESTGIAFRMASGSIYDVQCLDPEGGVFHVRDWSRELVIGGL